MKTILYPPTIDWDYMFQRPQQIMRQFAKNGWRVIYCNKKQRHGAELEEVEPNLFICRDLVKFTQEERGVDVFYTTWAKCIDLANIIPSKVIIYDRVDDFPEWEPYEESMIKLANIVLTTSKILYEKTHHANKHLVRNACDFDHFYPNESAKINGSNCVTVGFVGALGKWVDVELLEEIGNFANLVIVGPQFGVKVPKNCVYHGIQSYSNLPDFYHSIDIGLIPFKVRDRVAQSANPIKMYEYLASGLPVLATETYETSLYPGHVYTIKEGENIQKKIDSILADECASRIMDRMVIAKENTWERRFEVIEKEINKLI